MNSDSILSKPVQFVKDNAFKLESVYRLSPIAGAIAGGLTDPNPIRGGMLGLLSGAIVYALFEGAKDYVCSGKLEDKLDQSNVHLRQSLENDKEAKKVLKKVKGEIKRKSDSYSFDNNYVSNLGHILTRQKGNKTYMAVLGHSDCITAVGTDEGSKHIYNPSLYDFVEENPDTFKVALSNNNSNKSALFDGSYQLGQYDISLLKVDMSEGKIKIIDRQSGIYPNYSPKFKINGDKLVKESEMSENSVNRVLNKSQSPEKPKDPSDPNGKYAAA